MRRAASAFTLIELLVVISIIALLISILLPSLAAARETAKSMACLSNTRQGAVAMNLYTQDNDGSYIPVIFPGAVAADNRYWPQILVMKGRYTSTVQVFDCPTFVSASAHWKNPPARFADGLSAWRLTEIGYNNDYIGTSVREVPTVSNAALTPARVEQIMKPSETILLGDSYRSVDRNGWNLIFPILEDDLSSGHATPRHQQSANIAWIDGHASRVKSTAGPENVYTTDALTSRHDNPNFWDRK